MDDIKSQPLGKFVNMAKMQLLPWSQVNLHFHRFGTGSFTTAAVSAVALDAPAYVGPVAMASVGPDWEIPSWANAQIVNSFRIGKHFWTLLCNC